MAARVIVLAGPSGAGKSRLAERTGLPVLRLDDFYRAGDDPALPLVTAGPTAGLVDWDDPRSWLEDDAIAAVRTLCAEGRAVVPAYEISRNRPEGTHDLDLEGSALFVAEGIFAHRIVAACAAEGLLAAAYCLTQRPGVTFWRRLMRDLREHRKPPLVLLRRGVALMRGQRSLVAEIVAAGCEPVSAEQAAALISRLPVPR